jgi:hypothetical protein
MRILGSGEGSFGRYGVGFGLLGSNAARHNMIDRFGALRAQQKLITI